MWKRVAEISDNRATADLCRRRVLILGVIGTASATLPPGGTFIDDNGIPHEGSIEAIFAADITRGCNPPTNDKYCPGEAIDREQMAAFLNRALNLSETDEDFYVDDETSIFEDDINRLAASGITRGCGSPDSRKFCPTSSLTRGQMAAVLVRAFGYAEGLGSDLFTDDDQSHFEDDIDLLATAGVTKGCNPPENTEYCPNDTVNRGQMASFLARGLELAPIVVPPPTTTTVADPVRVDADVIIVGDSIAAAGVIEAIQDDLSLVWIAESGYPGGQASAAGVSAMDDESSEFLRNAVPYSGLVDAYRATRFGRDTNYGSCRFADLTGTHDNYCPQPAEVRSYFDAVINTDPIVMPVVDMLQVGDTVLGIVGADGTEIRATITIDATEFQDLYPLIEELSWEVSSCVQDVTWSAVREVDSRVFPDPDAGARLRSFYGDDTISQWIAGFEERVSLDGISRFTNWTDVATQPWAPAFEWQYRRLAGELSGLNHVAVNYPMTVEAITDPQVRNSTLIAAKDKTYLYLWWEHYVLGLNNGISTTQGFDSGIQMVDSPSIPNDFEQHFPPIPYVREARRLSDPVMTWEDIRTRGTVASDSAFAWGNGTDSHGCPISPDQASGYGVFGVDPGVFIQDDVSGFYPAVLRSARVDRIVASSVRMQPSEYAGGYALGKLLLEELRGELPAEG